MRTRIILLFSLICGLITPSEACRLPHRLLIQQRAPVQPSLVLLSGSLQQTEFDLSGVTGYYTEITPRLEFRRGTRMVVGSDLPLIALHRNEGSKNKVGLGNPVFFGQYRAFSRGRSEASVGLQVEVPAGNHSDGLASDHVEFLPHIAFAHAVAWIGVSTDVGLRESVGGSDHYDDEEPTLLVDPHADTELLYRIALHGNSPVIGITPSVYVDGQWGLNGNGENSRTAAAGVIVGWPIADSYLLIPAIEFPITTDRRMNWTFRFSAEARL